MAHHISAVILKAEIDAEVARRFDLKILELPQGFSMVALEPSYCDHWSDKLGIHGFVSERPILNCKVVHHMILEAAPESRFAVIETDYFGGAGDQAAAVYEGQNVVMQAAVTGGPINEALRLLGVRASFGQDEFDALGLVRFRNFGHMFEQYWAQKSKS